MTTKMELFQQQQQNRQKELRVIGREQREYGTNKRYNKKLGCMTPIKRGEVFWIDEAEVRGKNEIAKNRLGVIVSNNKQNYKGGTVQVVYLTSASKVDSPNHVKIDYLGTPSTIVCEQATTVSVERVGARSGYLPKYIMQRVDDGLCYTFDIEKQTETEVSLWHRNKQLEDCLFEAYNMICDLKGEEKENVSLQYILNAVQNNLKKVG